MHVNYEFILKKSQQLAAGGKILDYGCGAGDVVKEGLARGLNIVGVEAFYGGSSVKEIAGSYGLLDKSVFALSDDFAIPFLNESFDLVVANQVMEHVENLTLTLREIKRVLKPNATLLTLFPDAAVLREGHCGIPFAHMFNKKSCLRYPYMRLMRGIGLGYHKNNKSPNCWSLDFIDWLDKYTFYRSLSEIKAAFRSQGFGFERVEHEYIEYRFQHIGITIPRLIARNFVWQSTARLICRLLGGLVIVAHKQGG